jgi:hypothetical protein
MTDPAPLFISPDELGASSETDLERDYSNIGVFTEFEEYGTDVEKIYITAMNNNPAKGFYFLMVPFIERKTDDGWARLNYQDMALGYQTQALCPALGNRDRPTSTLLAFDSVNLRDELIAGEYRMVVFVGDTKAYAPFKIIDGSAAARRTRRAPEYPMTDPAPFFGSPDEPADNPNVDLERDYSSIEAFADLEEYSPLVKRIYITVRNNNQDKGFYLCLVPFIERKTGDGWVRQNYQEPALRYQQWRLCAAAGSSGNPNWTRMNFNVAHLRGRLHSGEYRIAVFVGDTAIYAPFKIL